MNARIDASNIRIRLVAPDVVKLAAGDTLECQIVFVEPEPVFGFRVESAEIDAPQARLAGNVLVVSLPRALTSAWPSNEEVGWTMELGRMRVSVEKDLQRLRSAPAEPAADERFPNPRAQHHRLK